MADSLSFLKHPLFAAIAAIVIAINTTIIIIIIIVINAP